MGSFRVLLTTVVLLALTGCNFPADAGGTLDRVKPDGVLRIGVSPRPPWVIVDGAAIAGSEAALLREWAAELGADIKWVRGNEAALVRALKERQIDVLIGGIRAQSPWTQEAAATRECFAPRIVVARPAAGGKSSGPIRNLDGRVVAYPKDRPDFAALIAGQGGLPRATNRVHGQVAAIYDFEADQSDLVPTGLMLERESLVMLVPRGESGFLYRLDRFLRANCRLPPNRRATS